MGGGIKGREKCPALTSLAMLTKSNKWYRPVIATGTVLLRVVDLHTGTKSTITGSVLAVPVV